VITAGDTASARFDVTCPDEFGGLVIRLLVSGEDQDPSGYTVVLDGQPQTSGIFGGSLGFRVGAGTHTAEVTDRTASCPVDGGAIRTVQVPPGGATTVDFQITCTVSPPAGRRKEIVFETGRAGLGPRGSAIIQLYSINADGTGLRLLSASPGGEQMAASWSSDGSRLLFSNVSPGNDPFLFIMNADGSEPTPYLDVRGVAAWSPDMSQVALSIVEPRVGLGTLPFGETDPNRIAFFENTDISRPTWSPDGGRLAYVRNSFALEVLNLETGVPGTLPLGFAEMVDPQWSPDGEWLLFSGSTDFGARDLYLVHPDGTDLHRLKKTPEDEITPSWSPDGTQIAFATNRDGNYEIYVMKADGTHPVRLTNDPGLDVGPAWRP
jgi:TolB protein